MKQTIRKKRCEKFKECRDWIMGCGDTHSDRHARECIRNRFCYAHCLMWLEDNFFRVDLLGNINKSGPRSAIAIRDQSGTYRRLERPFALDDIVSYQDPEDMDISSDIFKLLLSAKNGMTAVKIAAKLKKGTGSVSKEQVESVIRNIRKLGRTVQRGRNGRGMTLFSLDHSGFHEEIKKYAGELDEIELLLERGCNLNDIPKKLMPREDQEEHIWL